VRTLWAFACGRAELALGNDLKPAECMDQRFEDGIDGLLASFRARRD
jgi:hypothetical protein